MTLPPLHLPLLSAGFFGGVVSRMLQFVAMRVRRSDQGMRPSLSPELRAQTVALYLRLSTLTRDFHRLVERARAGTLRVYPDRAAPRPRAEGAARPVMAPALPPSPFGAAVGVVQGPTLPAQPTGGFGSMLGFLPAEYRDAVAGMLTNAEVVALVQASPSAARLLRSLCWGLGMTPPAGVFPPPRKRRPAEEVRAGSSRGRGSAARRGAGAPRRAVLGALDALASPQARDRWWARARGVAGGADTLPADAVRSGAGAPGRFAKC